jgi:uncharacterized protein YkwD
MSRLLVLAATAVIAVAAVPGPALAAEAPKRTSLTKLETAILERIDTIRVAHGLSPLTADNRLKEAASEHSVQMLSLGYFAHASADGAQFWQRFARYYRLSGFRYWSVGENMIWRSATLDASEAIKVWMASPRHRANILQPRWREVGVAAIHETSAPGVFGGHSVTVIIPDFGARRTR